MTQGEVIEVEGQLESRDYFRANFWFLAHKSRFLILLVILVTVGLPPLDRFGVFGPRDYREGGSLFPFLLGPIMLLAIVGGTYFKSRRHFASHRGINQRLHYRFSSEGMQTKSSITSASCSWDLIAEARETKHAFLLFVSRRQMMIIPKRYFEATSSMGGFRSLLRANLGSRARLPEVA